MTEVRGMKEAAQQAKAGLMLFADDSELQGDVPAATKFKEEMDAKMAALDKEVEALPGKENAKARSEKGKTKMAIKNQKDYIDACKVVKGSPPIHGHFVVGGAAAVDAKRKGSDPVPEETPAEVKSAAKDSKAKPKKTESAGISKAERDELESLKKNIIERKAALKEEGLSGGQINKDEQVAAWVTRMNELKLKENPGADAKDEKKAGKKKLGSQVTAELTTKQKELDDYANQLKADFKYSKKEIMADPDYIEMKAIIDKMSK